jgi:hypothetical protein
MVSTADYIATAEADENARSFADREMKASPASFVFTSSVSVVSDKETKPIDMNEANNKAIFTQNCKYWNQETNFLSVNNFDNSYFKGIVEMGEDAVPFILEELEKGPTPLVHALDLIFPGVVTYDGFVNLKEVCDKWVSILK